MLLVKAGQFAGFGHALALDRFVVRSYLADFFHDLLLHLRGLDDHVVQLFGLFRKPVDTTAGVVNSHGGSIQPVLAWHMRRAYTLAQT
jgi:hypothetical protein